MEGIGQTESTRWEVGIKSVVIEGSRQIGR